MHEDKQTTTLPLPFLFSERTANKESPEQIKYLYKDIDKVGCRYATIYIYDHMTI